MLQNFIIYFQKLLLSYIEAFLNNGNWKIKITLLSLVLALLLSFPSYDVFLDNNYLENWKPVLMKVDNPLVDLTTFYGPGSHASKLNLRLTVPVIAKLLHLGIGGIILLQFLFGISLLYATACLTHKITGDRVTSLFVSLTVASIFPGITSFVELRGMFDGVAISLLTFALLLQNPVWIWLCLFLSFWTDERALLGSFLVWLFHLLDQSPQKKFHLLSLLQLQPMSVVVGWATYAITRLYISVHFGLRTPVEGVGLRILLDQVNNIPMGIWTGLEGAWLLVLFAFILLWLQGKRIDLFLFLAFMMSIIGASLSVVDITRSMAYTLPAVFIALQVLSSVERIEDVRRYALLACLISILWPNYYAGGKHSIWWNYPLPIQIVRWLKIILYR